MSALRPAAVAGSFYPADPGELRHAVNSYLQEFYSEQKKDRPAPKVIIAPHAGYVYSGRVAANAYSRLIDAKPAITRVVLLGPSHHIGFEGIAVSSATAYQTPLGNIPIDSSAISEVLTLARTGFLDDAHRQEHSLEVHLPFLQQVLGKFSLVPLVVGDATKEDVASVLETMWGGPETLIVISSDLSHFHAYDNARLIDSRTSEKILNLDASLIGEEACGARPLNGLLHLLKEKGQRLEQLLVQNSGDTVGDKARVVGYGSYIMNESSQTNLRLPLACRQRLLQVARESVFQVLCGNKVHLQLDQFPDLLNQERASFVTLEMGGQLRGCIGSLVAHRPLVADIAGNAQAAAFKDPRFKAINLDEYQRLEFHISVLSIPEKMTVNSRQELIETIRPGIDGLILERESHRATYLPSVWQQLESPELFITELRKKAGLSGEGWSNDTIIHRYSTEEFC